MAGQRCAEALRRAGFERAIRVVCSEPHRPYDKPPLSKDLLTDAARDGEVSYRTAEWYQEQSVDLLLGVSAVKLNANESRLTLSDGSMLRYEQLLISTGGRPRSLPLLAGYDNVSVSSKPREPRSPASLVRSSVRGLLGCMRRRASMSALV